MFVLKKQQLLITNKPPQTVNIKHTCSAYGETWTKLEQHSQPIAGSRPSKFLLVQQNNSEWDMNIFLEIILINYRFAEEMELKDKSC